MKLQFSRARHGWLPATLEVDGRDITFDVSHVPYDSLSELVAALSGLLSAPGEYVARINEEPTEHDWRFWSSAEPSATFEVVSYERGRRTKDEAEVIATFRGAPLDVVVPLWRGLRELESRAQNEAFHSHWNEPFPSNALDRLTTRIEHSQATPP